MNNEKKLSVFLKGLVKENPVLVLILGTCPTLAMSSNVISALAMGVSATLVLLCSNVVISLLRKVIPDQEYLVILSLLRALLQWFKCFFMRIYLTFIKCLVFILL